MDVKECHGNRDGSRRLGYGVSRVGVVLTSLVAVRLRKELPSSPLGVRTNEQQSCIPCLSHLRTVSTRFALSSLQCKPGRIRSSPTPNGCYPVGTKTIVLRDPHRSRDLLVTMWYPAVEGTSAHAPYMDKKTADALAEEWKLQPDFQRLVRTHARTLAAIAQGRPFSSCSSGTRLRCRAGYLHNSG